MALQPIPLGPDVLLTQGNGPYADNNTFDNLFGADLIPMSNGVSILVFPVFHGASPFEVGTIARAFTVNGDGTQNWGNALLLGADNTGGSGVAIDATRALIVYPGGGGILFRVLTLSGLNLTAGATSVLTMGGGFTGFNIPLSPLKMMSPTTAVFGFRATGPSRSAVRVQLLQVTGTSVLVDFSNALNLVDVPSLPGVGAPDLCQVDKYTCGFFWTDLTTNASYFGTVQFNTTFDSMTDVGFGGSQLYDGTVYTIFRFREIQFGFVLAVGTRQPGSHPVAVMLEFNSAAHFLTKGPIVELTQTAPNPPVQTQSGVVMAGHQAVLLYRRVGGVQEHYRIVELNLGTYAREIVEIGFVDFDLLNTVAGGPGIGPQVALSPRRVLFTYTPAGGGGLTIERMITVGVPVVDPLRWRQRDDCLTPGSATPCICYNLTPNVVCIPPWWLRITSSVQFGGGVGPRNHAY